MADSPTFPEVAGAVGAPNIGAPAVDHRVTNCQKLDEAIEKLFSRDREHADRLVEAIREQSTSMNAMFKSLTKAVEALKQQPQSTDTKTAFWTAYKTLADEFDKEFQRKYGNDLDTSLIFAGLFSAVSSAFIIQIQPELQPDPNTTVLLLGLLVHNITGAAAPAGLLPSPTRPTAIVVVAQSLLYFSLFSTLLAALLAVLGKQWLLHYDSIGERGTIEERGLERQRKFDGLRRWKFDVVMQMFPLLLQFSLLLFATALSLYLWTIHRGIALIVLTLTVLAFIVYTAMVISAVAWADSPFQSSLSFVLKSLLKRIPLPEFLRRFATKTRKAMDTAILHLGSSRSRTSSAFAALMKAMKPLLPLFRSVEDDDPAPSQSTHLFGPPPPPSKEGSAVIWALETSTDPVMVQSAAAMVPELQWWPMTFDIRPSLKRLADTFQSCVNDRLIRKGMGNRATASIKAFGILGMVAQNPSWASDLWTFKESALRDADDDLQAMITFFKLSRPKGRYERMMGRLQPPVMTQWALRFIAAQHPSEEHIETVLRSLKSSDTALKDRSFLTDFLFCLNSFFSLTMARDRSVLNKSDYTVLLTTLLFENLAKRLEEPWDHQIVDNILAQVSRCSKMDPLLVCIGEDNHCRNAAYHLCAVQCLSLTAITSILRVVSVWDEKPVDFKSDPRDVEWVYKTLDSLHGPPNLTLIGDLLQVLFVCRPIHGKPSATALRMILSSFPVSSASSTDPSWDSIKDLVLRVLCHADHWFSDIELGPILTKDSVWPSLAYSGSRYYTILGEKLSNTPGGKSIISQDLPGWLDQDYSDMGGEQAGKFCTVLSRVWDADEAEADQFGTEKPRVMVFSALANAWDRIDFSSLQVRHKEIVEFLGYTVSTAFSNYPRAIPAGAGPPSQDFKDTIMIRLGDALGRAGERAKSEIDHILVEQNSMGRTNEIAELLTRIALGISGELRGQPNDNAQMILRDAWIAEVASLRKAFETAAEGMAEEVSPSQGFII